MREALKQLAEEVWLEKETLPLEEYYSSIVYIAINSETLEAFYRSNLLSQLDPKEVEMFDTCYGVKFAAKEYTSIDDDTNYLMLYFTVDDNIPDKKACIRKASN